MLDLAGHAPIDKQTLVGGCIRLPLQIDAAPLQAELAALPADLWGRRDGRVGVHEVAEAIFLRGHAPAQGDLPIEDRPALARLPSVRDGAQRHVIGLRLQRQQRGMAQQLLGKIAGCQRICRIVRMSAVQRDLIADRAIEQAGIHMRQAEMRRQRLGNGAFA